MKILILKCDACGAPLDIPAGTSSVACLYCDNQILIDRSSQPAPAPPKAAEKKPDDPVAKLDREWEAYRAKYLKRGEDGQYDIPVEEHCRMGMWATLVIGVLLIIAAVSLGIAGAALIVLLFMAVTLFGLRKQMKVAQVYTKSKRNYEQDRLKLVKASSEI